MSRGLHLTFESFTGDHDTEMCFLGGGIGHGFVVRVQVGVVEDFEICRGKRGLDLSNVSRKIGKEVKEEGTFVRMMSSMGV